MPIDPRILIIRDKLTKIKEARTISRIKFAKHFDNLPKIIKQITEIKT